MSSSDIIASRLDALSRSTFRARFHLGPREQAQLRDKGLATMQQHAAELIAKRLAPAAPLNDGKQTPMRGYPVFVAQHATATCCRSCLAKWHGIAKGHELTADEQAFVVDLIAAWLEREQSA